ncbi:probable hexokinase-like 2 protein [Malania oleifera]|uniref:probable hexokinase-like 2 protein n=1 Tax=Malania oleifera TaxID=397392 RepID=UPI0025ADFE4B|nr:probable hexokinase-like 2 protein [Malania oleifera]
MRKDVVVAAAVATAATVVVVAEVVRRRQRRRERQWKKAQNILRKFARECATPVPNLWQVANALVSDMQAALSSAPPETGGAALTMLVSYVASLPTGDEEGVYYGINLKGTNFLMIRGQLEGKNHNISEPLKEEVAIPSALMAATTQELFDYIAAELAQFVSTDSAIVNETAGREKILGFTLSLPVEQDAASSATAIRWKSLSIDDPVEKELVNDINRALQKHGLDMRVFALVDDTIGRLAGGRYYSRDSVAAVTLGMGTNAAYVEPAHAVPKWSGPSPNSGEMVLNMEWANFSSSHLPVTEFDISLDAESSNPGTQTFEKLISGMYLGEIVRRVLLKMAQQTALFGDIVPPMLMVPYQLRSPDMAAMHQDTSEDREAVGEKLKEIFGVEDCSPMVREVVAEVCDVVAERGARLVGAGMVGIVKKLGRIKGKRSVITVEGGLYEHYRLFRNYMHSSVWEMLGNELADNVVIDHSHGGSGAGALFLAASQTLNHDS